MRLTARQPDGQTLAQHLTAAWRASGRQPEELAMPDVPRLALGVYQAWRSLAESRPAGLGKSVVGYVEIDAWQRVNNVRMTPWELETLIEMDRASLQSSDSP